MKSKFASFWSSIWVLACLQFTNMIDFVVLMPMGPQLMRELQLSTAQFGLVVSAYTFSAAIAGIVGAFWIDSFDRKKSLLICYIGFAIGTVLCGLSSGYLGLLMSRMVTGVFGGLSTALVLAIVGDIVPEDKRGTAMGIIMTSFSIASIVGVPLGLYVAYWWGWHSPFIGLGALSIAFSLLIVSIIPPIPIQSSPLKEKRRHHELRDILLKKSHILAYLYSTSLIFSGFLLFPFLSQYMITNMGFPERHLATTYLVGGIGTLATTFLIGKLSDRFGKHRLFTILALGSILPVLWFANAGKTPFIWTLIVSSIFMILMSGRMIPAMAMITLVPASDHRGGFMSIHSTIQQLAMSGASFFGGVLIYQESGGALVNFNFIGFISVGFIILSLFLSRKQVFANE